MEGGASPWPWPVTTILGRRKRAGGLPCLSLWTKRPTGALVFGRLELGTQSGGVLEDALGARVMDELLSADQSFLHLDLAPGAEAIGEFGQRWVRSRGHGRHFLRGRRTLSTERDGALWPRLGKIFLSSAVLVKKIVV